LPNFVQPNFLKNESRSKEKFAPNMNRFGKWKSTIEFSGVHRATYSLIKEHEKCKSRHFI